MSLRWDRAACNDASEAPDNAFSVDVSGAVAVKDRPGWGVCRASPPLTLGQQSWRVALRVESLSGTDLRIGLLRSAAAAETPAAVVAGDDADGADDGAPARAAAPAPQRLRDDGDDASREDDSKDNSRDEPRDATRDASRGTPRQDDDRAGGGDASSGADAADGATRASTASTLVDGPELTAAGTSSRQQQRSLAARPPLLAASAAAATPPPPSPPPPSTAHRPPPRRRPPPPAPPFHPAMMPLSFALHTPGGRFGRVRVRAVASDRVDIVRRHGTTRHARRHHTTLAPW